MEYNALIVSVGGSPQPIIKAIEWKRPDFILFAVSEGSRAQVESEVLPALDYVPQHEFALVSKHEDIGTCYQEIRDAASAWLARRGIADSAVYVDNTGGTKPMSSALALAAVERFSAFTYVGGELRSAEGLGVVLDGAEMVIPVWNPWNQYAARDLERANWLLSEFHADAAARILSEAAGRCDAEFRSCLLGFADLAEALGEADRFRFGAAVRKLGVRRSALEFTLGYPTFSSVATLSDAWDKLDRQTKTDGKTPGRETLLELLANAERRAKQSRYDDAAGRLYRAVELRGQQLARYAFGAELGRPRLDDFPANRRADAQALLGAPDADGRYKIGVQKLYEALSLSEDAILREQGAAYERLKGHLAVRNGSLLAHGLQPVSEDAFNNFWRDALDVLGVQESEIPRWPELKLALPRAA